MKKPKKKSLESYAERHARAWCKRNGFCEAHGLHGIDCGPRKPTFPLLEWCHIIGRRTKRLKFVPENSVCLCGQHHVYFTNNPIAFFLFVEEKHPGRVDALYELEQEYPKWGTAENCSEFWIQKFKEAGVKIGKTVKEDRVEE